MSLYRAYFVPGAVDPFGSLAVVEKELIPVRSGNCDSVVEFGYELSTEAITFFLWAFAKSSDCCNIDVRGFDVNNDVIIRMGPRTGPHLEFPVTSYTFGWVTAKVSDFENFRKPPVVPGYCERNPCPCEAGVECLRRKYSYEAWSLGGLVTIALGSIEITVCADGSFSAGGFAWKYDPLFGAHLFETKIEHIYKQETCEVEY